MNERIFDVHFKTLLGLIGLVTICLKKNNNKNINFYDTPR